MAEPSDDLAQCRAMSEMGDDMQNRLLRYRIQCSGKIFGQVVDIFQAN